VYGELEKTFSILKKEKMRKEKRKKLNYIRFQNTSKYISLTMIALMLISSFAAISVVTVQASPHDWSITLHATITNNPYWGYYGGYHDIWQAIKTELTKIGINLQIDYHTDFVWYDQVWTDDKWNQPAPTGWDMTIFEWWLQPHALEPWFSSMVFSWLQPQHTVEEGFNVHPWNNSKADALLEQAMTSYDAETRKYFIDKWQEVFMHDLPWINLYYPRIYEIMGEWVEGYEPTGTWWYDVSNLSLNTGAMPPARQALHQDWIYYGVTEEIWSLLPTYMDTYTEEQMETLQWGPLYRWSFNWSNFQTGVTPDPRDYLIIPWLADGDPVPQNPDNTIMRINLKQGVRWSDGNLFDADDVEMTFNKFVLEKTAGCTGIGDFVWWMKNVTKVSQYVVDVYLKRPVADFISLMADDWGGTILPYHIFNTVASPNLEQTEANTNFDDPSKWAPVIGPFKLKELVAGEYALLERNPLYFGFNTSIVSPAWGPDPSVQAIYLKTVPDPAVRLLEFQTYRLDLGEYPTAPLEVFQELEKDPNLNVFQYDYPASNPIWINFNNPYLSNRLIREAIAYAIPYDKIFSEILPSWGIETAYPGKTYVLPNQYYTEPNTPDPNDEFDGTQVHLFNAELETYYHDIPKAIEKMELWWHSQQGNTPYTDGPVGDSDLSGLVDLDDYLILNDRLGDTESWPIDVVPGNMIDPDFNNDGTPTTLTDGPLWSSSYGTVY
jgi:ABC-type transport system substrate-binding protein